MSTNAKPFPLYTDGTSIFFTTDGVNFNSVGGGGQDPSNVAITGGSIAGTTINGQSAASAIAANAFIASALAWERTQYATMIAAVPALTGFSWMKLGAAPLGAAAGAVTGDSNTEGGGVSPGATYGFGVSTFQNPPIGNWAIAFRFKVTGNASTNVAQFGISSIAGPNTDAVWFGIRNASSGTNFFARIVAGGTTDTVLGAFDTNWHDGVITDDGTTIKYWFDGVIVGSTTTRTNLVTTAYQPFMSQSAGSLGIATRLMVGYVQP